MCLFLFWLTATKCLLVNKYVIELVIKIQQTQINITHVPTTKQAKYKRHNIVMQFMSF